MNTGTGNTIEAKDSRIPASAAEIAPPLESPDLSSVEADRQALEQYAESQGETPEQARIDVAAGKEEILPIPTSEAVSRMEKDQVTVEVEKILEEGLAEHWKTMPEALKPMFKQKGEQVAKAISQMIKQSITNDLEMKGAKELDVADVMELVLEWLRMLPRTNKYWLEQEAKIKTDRLAGYLAGIRKTNEEQTFKTA
jgi:hypothetical protein